ncbi:nonribosomal peptide synthase GliP [Elsinoe ampelina]|uniref:Nonribosomal peptide synthase GliP n=1 Tax=Elsinoe ampelina TaxID=302913 RepID=A0A6A6G0D4_9PEZI|nr:nonribosomal peptide synthase GliP [Elsinoe ampelina]
MVSKLTTPDLSSLVSAVVQRHPLNLAIDHQDGSLTYQELDHASSALAQTLIHSGATPGSPILLLTAHGTRNIVAIIAILKCGCSYVPLDRDTWSIERLRYVIDTVDSPLLLNTTERHFKILDRSYIHFNKLPEPTQTSRPLQIANKSSSEACIIFTSGTTGQPKGVCIPHGAIASYAQTEPFDMSVAPGDRVLHILSVAFDASTGMLFSILANGGTVVPSSPARLFEDAATCHILASTPSILRSLPAPGSGDFPLVHTILLGGEVPPVDLLTNWLSSGVRILNAYGPTETTCASTMHIVELCKQCRKVHNRHIGSAMPRGPVYLLATDDQPIQEDNTEGEIVIAGCGLAIGYYKDPAKTAEKFDFWNGIRIYRTGDTGHWSRNNSGERILTFCGRKDRIVKNRGFLINLDTDIEQALQQLYPAIKAIHAFISHERLLVVVCPGTLDATGIMAHARQQLSRFHVPDRIFVRDTLPLSPNGKIDQQSLQASLQTEVQGAVLSQDDSDPVVSPFDIINMGMSHILQINCDELQADSNFFALGGNSLQMLRLSSLCRAQNLHISATDIYIGQTIEGIARRAQRISSPKTPQPGACIAGQPFVESSKEAPKLARLTSEQLTFCAQSSLHPGTNTNRVNRSYKLRDLDRTLSAWRQVWAHEEIFRIEPRLNGDSGVQELVERTSFNLSIRDFDTYQHYRKAIDELPFDVGYGMSFHVMQLRSPNEEESEFTVAWTVHHSLLDGFSMNMILNKVENAMAGKSVTPGPSYLKAAQEIEEFRKRHHDRAEVYWRNKLDGLGSTSTNIPYDLVTDGMRFASVEKKCNFSHMHERLVDLATRHSVTLAAVYYTAWAATVTKRTGHNRIVVGAVFSGRSTHPHFLDVAGTMTTSLPLVVDVQPDRPVSEQLQTTMREVASASEWSWTSPGQHGVSLTNLLATQYDFPNLSETLVPLRAEVVEKTAIPLTILADDRSFFRFVFDSGCYSAQLMADLISDFEQSLTNLLESPVVQSYAQSSKNRGPQPSDSHRRTWEESQSKPKCLQDALAQSASRHGTRIAIERGVESLTYTDLDSRASIVASYLSRVSYPGDVIGIWADGSVFWIVGILGILKAGCAYCPIDPAYPQERQESVILASKSSSVLFPRSEQRQVLKLSTTRSLSVEDILKQSSAEATFMPILVDDSRDAVIVFTSGTTGTPKGVPISHRGLLALQSNPEATMFSGPGIRIAQFMSPAFDYCTNEILSALLHGGTLILRDPEQPFEHLKHVDAATITPSVLSSLDPRGYDNIRTLYVTGEPVSPGLVASWAPGRLMYNAYGPAECSICTSFTRLEPDKPVTIGRPIRTARMYILDKDLKPTPTGAEGEIYLAGIQVMRGYIGADVAAADKIMADPWYPGSRVYRTGDYGRWDREGSIVYIGRLDRQVKIRGFRVELASVEQKMYELCPGLVTVAAMNVNDALVAYVKGTSVNIEALRETLSRSLQPSWVPQVIIQMHDIPMTVNRKIDYQKLLSMRLPEQKVNLDDPDELRIAGIWKELLRRPSDSCISPSDDFVRLGGHSVLQLLLAARLQDAYCVKLSIRHVIANPMLKDQAIMIRQVKSSTQQNLDIDKKSEDSEEESRLTYLERQVWVQYQVASSTSTFNIPVHLVLNGELDKDRFVQALNACLSSRKVLRSNFTMTREGPKRTFRANPPRVQQVGHINIDSVVATPFDLAKDELIRVFLIRNELLIVTTHAIADLNSVQVLLSELSRCYNSAIEPCPRFEYLSNSAWASCSTLQEREYWARTLADAPGHLPIGKPVGHSLFKGSSKLHFFEGPLVAALNDLCDTHNVTKHQLVATAAAQTLQWLNGGNDIVIGMPFQNRNGETERTSMGLHLDRLPLRIHSDSTSTCEDMLADTRRASQAALANAIPFHEIMLATRTQPTLRHHPIFEVMVTFHLSRAVEECLDIPGVECLRNHVHPPGSKFAIMFEWTELSSDKWMLRIEYDDGRLPAETLERLEQTLRCVLDGLAAGKSRAAIHGDLSRLESRDPRRPSVLSRTRDLVRREMADVLGRADGELDAETSFFEAGGDSVAALMLHKRLVGAGVDVAVAAVFDYPTASGLAEYLS